MARPRQPHPTPAELEVLQVLWRLGPCSVRQVRQALNQQPPRAYTTVMSLLNIMADKGLVRRRAQGRAFVYSARADRETTLGGILGDVVKRAFDGSAGALVARLLAQSRPDPDELDEIRKVIAAYRRRRGKRP